MAKKARRKLEDEEEDAFEFPPFDENAFVTKEFEVGTGVVLVGLITIVLGVVAWAISVTGITVWIPLALGIAGIAATPYVARRLLARSTLYTRGDWAGLLAMEFFGWLALWFLLLNLSSTAL